MPTRCKSPAIFAFSKIDREFVSVQFASVQSDSQGVGAARAASAVIACLLLNESAS